MSFMMAFGWAGVMLCMGVFLRAKVPVLRNMLVPASVIGGILGFLFINICISADRDIGTDTNMYTSIVNNLFTVSFISISLTGTGGKGKTSGTILRGAVALGLIWCLLYALTPILAVGVVALSGKAVGMDSIYGMLIQFAFCQGPGQAAAYGGLFEQYGWQDASMVAVTFAAIGFLVAFLIGIPAAMLGVKKGLAKHCGKIDRRILKGYMNQEEQTGYMLKETTCSSNLETLAFHFAVIGVSYILAVGISKVLGYLPGFLGTSMSGLMFMNGMYAAYIIRWIMGKLGIGFLLDDALQRKITGWTADYLVICSFMGVSMKVVGRWIVPVLLVSVVTAIVTFCVCFFFGQRIGGEHDFERTLGIYGTCTGTVPSGISLVRIVDPALQTTTNLELGACNLVMLASTPVYLIVLAAASGSISMGVTIMGLLGCCILYLAALKLTKSWGRKTYSWK